MSEATGEKTEQATPKRLEEAIKKGQIPQSSDVQTVFVLLGGILGLAFTGHETWGRFVGVSTGILGHLSQYSLTPTTLPGYFITAMLGLVRCVSPIAIGSLLGSLLAGAAQNRFQTASEALVADWSRVNPASGLQRIFSIKNWTPTAIGFAKLTVIVLLAYSQVKTVAMDPIFYSPVSTARIAVFLVDSSLHILLRILAALAVIAALDYAYQYWRNQKDMMMTKEEVREEMKSTEGNPHVRSQMRRRHTHTLRKMLAQVPQADVVVTNPTHVAVALRYDRRSMRAPKIVAKGLRQNAARIREIARQHQVPIIENKPVARMLFKYGKVDGEIPAQLYAAVAEILAWVYRVNRYRYYSQDSQTLTPGANGPERR